MQTFQDLISRGTEEVLRRALEALENLGQEKSEGEESEDGYSE